MISAGGADFPAVSETLSGLLVRGHDCCASMVRRCRTESPSYWSPLPTTLPNQLACMIYRDPAPIAAMGIVMVGWGRVVTSSTTLMSLKSDDGASSFAEAGKTRNGQDQGTLTGKPKVLMRSRLSVCRRTADLRRALCPISQAPI